MKKSEIVKGKQYTDGKGSIREVLDIGPQYTLYNGQMETDNLQYRLITKKRGPHSVGSVLNSTRSAFASWARQVVIEKI